jgi:D-glycero-D-manno-heptose 1,7-bisphosphate phosphatase
MAQKSFEDLQHIEYVFLDRDGVINRKPPEGQYVSNWKHFDVLPGVEEAIARLNGTGRKVIVVTNQRGIALRYYTEQDLVELHRQLLEHLTSRGARIDAIYYCPHDRDQCNCRKPGPGMFLQAFKEFPGASGSNSVVVGDSISDIEAGLRLGMKTIFIHGDPSVQKAGAQRAAAIATATSGSLSDAVLKYLAPDRPANNLEQEPPITES